MNRKYNIVIITLLFHASSTLANGDALEGKNLYESRCIGCHSIDNNRVGPSLRGVIGRRAGSIEDYEYSDAVKKSKIVWTAENLNLWLCNPEALIPGQKMGYSISNVKDREDIIIYLMTVSKP